MMKITEKIRVEMAGNPLYYVNVPTKQGDVKTRYVDVELWNNGEPFAIPEGATVRAAFQKPDGFDVLNDCVVADNIATIELTDQLRAVPGKALCELMVQHQGKMITSSSFVVTIYPGLLQDGKPESSDEYQSFINALLALDTVSDTAKQALENALAAQAELDKLTSGAKEQADRAEAEADRAEIKAGEADVARNAAVEQAQAASTSKDEATKSKEETRQIKAETEQLKGQAAQAYEECKLAEQRVISLMSTDTRSYFFATLAERDEAEGMRNCDRCSVFETRADYIYDDHDIDGDGVNPEWVKTSDWDALKTVAWEIITGKPSFAAVALSGSYSDLIDKPRRYEQFITLADGNWDYAKSDKAVITLIEDTQINITNLYSGAVGLIKVYGGELLLPAGSKRSVDFDYLTALPGEHYTYTFVYDGAALCWARTVCINGE